MTTAGNRLFAVAMMFVVAIGSACRDEDPPNCFDASVKSGDRIAMHILAREDFPGPSGGDPKASACRPSLGVNVGDTIFARLTTVRFASRCSGYAARLEAPSGLQVTLSPRSFVNSSDAHEILGAEEFNGPCSGFISEDVGFDASTVPITIPASAASQSNVTARVAFYYNGGFTDGGGSDSCPPACGAYLQVGVSVVRDP